MKENTETQKRRSQKVQAVTLPPELQEAVVKLAEEREWSLAKTGGYLIRLGLETLNNQSTRAAKAA